MKLPQLNTNEVSKVEQFFDQHFEQRVWRIGFYDEPDLPLEEAGMAAVKRLVRLLAGIKKSHHVLCLGAHGINLGLYLAEEYQCKVSVFCDETLVDASAYEKIAAKDYPEKMTLSRGPLTVLPYDWDAFDMVLSVETLGFVKEKEEVLRQISSVLKPKGRILFTSLFLDQPSADLEELGLITKGQYSKLVSRTDLGPVLTKDMTTHLGQHYQALLQYLEDHKETAKKELGTSLTKTFGDWLSTYRQHLQASDIRWGLFLFQKSNL